MNDSEFISCLENNNISDIDEVLALLNAHIITNSGASNARIGSFVYNKTLGSFIKNNFSYMEEVSNQANAKYHFTAFVTNFEKSMKTNLGLYEAAFERYESFE